MPSTTLRRSHLHVQSKSTKDVPDSPQGESPDTDDRAQARAPSFAHCAVAVSLSGLPAAAVEQNKSVTVCEVKMSLRRPAPAVNSKTVVDS